MRTIGLIGGTGWVSTLEYYRLINEGVNRRLGGHEAARCVIYSLNFGDVMRLKAGDPEQAGVRALVVQTARTLEQAGAERLVLCANTLHWFADSVEDAVRVPLVHIAKATAAAVRDAGLHCVGLLGTRPTMERDFYRKHLRDAGIEALVPDEADRGFVHDTIYDELVKSRFLDESRVQMLAVIERLRQRGAEGVVLGCTEIPLLVRPEHCALPLFDTLRIHADAAVDEALSRP
ncbi:MAG TPA: aspartate/glutamate racemase family protein [Vicinamibacterales bacterium]|jgi:aspartate racemase